MFGAPLEQTDHAERAVACAMDMDGFAEEFRIRKNAEGVPLGVTRIGVHTGYAIVGNFGGERYFDYTAHGDAINTAARLESVNKQLGTRICVSAQAVEHIPGFKGRPVGILMLQGKSEGLKVFEPLTDEQAASPATEAYLQAYAKLEANDPGASQAFAAVVGQYGEDSLATFHLKRLLAGEKGAVATFDKK
jgi:adenylate cyclase